jgi:glucose-1-phosphate thymidylyltransferase
VIRKAVVLAAGKGSRLLPLTLAMPKEMIRVGVKPVIEHVIEVLKAGGIKQILVVVGRNKEAIMNYLGSGERLGVELYYRIQEKPKGSAHATYLGKEFVGGEDFVLVYGDNYFKPYEAIKGVLDLHLRSGACVTVLLHPVEDPTRFGIVKVDDSGRVLGIVEKPSVGEAEFFRSGGKFLNIAGLLVLRAEIFDAIEKTEKGINGEVWLTDSVELLRKSGKKVFGCECVGTRYDIGTFESLKEADRMEQQENSFSVDNFDNI